MKHLAFLKDACIFGKHFQHSSLDMLQQDPLNSFSSQLLSHSVPHRHFGGYDFWCVKWLDYPGQCLCNLGEWWSLLARRSSGCALRRGSMILRKKTRSSGRNPRPSGCVGIQGAKVKPLERSRHNLAASRSTIYQKDLTSYHSCRVRSRTFQVGDLVLHPIYKRDGMHNQSPPWDGSFVVRKNLHNGSY